MTISSTLRTAGPFFGDGSLSLYAFQFKIFSAGDLQVVRMQDSTGAETVLALNVDYSVALNADQDSAAGGTITLLLGNLVAGYTLTMTSDLENLQPTDLTNQGGFFPEVITDSLDRATIQIQQMANFHERSIMAPLSDGVVDMELPAEAARANKYLVFDANGLPTVSSGTGADAGLRTDLASVTYAAPGANLVGVNTVASSVGRTLRSRLLDTMSVKDFGAVGDGLANDDAAFTAAIAAAGVRGIYVPPATYALTGTFTGSFWSDGAVTISGGTVNYINRIGSTLSTSGNSTVTGTINTLTVGMGAGSVATNTAIGASALAANTNGTNCTAVGYQALQANTSGTANTAVGYNALRTLSTNERNTAVGSSAGESITSGDGNVLVGYRSGDTITTGNNNTVIGTSADVAVNSDSNSIVIGKDAVGNGANTTVIGNSATTSALITGFCTFGSGVQNLAQLPGVTFAPISMKIDVNVASLVLTTITPPSGYATYGGSIVFFARNVFSWLSSGNIKVGGTGTANRTYTFTYNTSDSKWYPDAVA